MKILTVESSSEYCSTTLWIDGLCQQSVNRVPKQHAQAILPMINQLLATASISLKQLDALAFGCGPGSFTGVRIAATVIQALAMAMDLPVMAVASPQALAQLAFRKYQAKAALVALDARMSQVYWGYYQLKQPLMLADKPISLSDPMQVIAPKQADWLAIGSGWRSYRKQLLTACQVNSIVIYEDEYPQAQDIATIATLDYQQGKTMPAELALPDYVRNKVTG